MSHYEKIMRGECYYPEIYGFFDLVVDDQGVSALAAAEQDAPLGELMRRLQYETSTYRNFCHTWSLVEGARRGSLDAVRRLILVGADVHVIQVWDKEGSRTSPIEEAAKNGYLDIVRVLLEAEVQETERLDYSMKALERAVQKGDHHRVTLLLRGKDFAKRADQCKNEALQEADGLEITELLVEYGADIRAKPNLPHQSPLANAAKRGCLAAVEYFLDRGADVNYWGYKNQYTALENAASGGFLDIVDRLLEAGALVMVAMELHAACVDGHLPVVERLLELGVDPDDCEAEWRAEEFTPLQRAAYGGYLELVEVLLEAGADVNHPATYPEGRTALQAAAEKGSVAVVRRLMEADADVNAPAGALGRTALQAAAEAGSLEIVNMLLEAGANYAEFGSLALAIEGGHISVVTRLLELDLRADSDDSDGSADSHDKDDKDEINSAYIRALRAATESGWTGVVGRLLEMRTPPVPDIGTDEYTSLLSAAARTGSVDIVELFVKAGFDVDGDTNGHGTVLQNAVRHGHVETVRFLLTSGADANKADGRIKPPLHLACKKQNVEIVKLLLKAGANPYALSYTNRTARHTAEKHKCQEIVQLLKEAEATTTFKRETNLSPRDVSMISKKELCAACKNLPFELFTVATQKSEHGETNWHPTLISLQMSARDGCPFCMFFWKQFDTTEAEGMNIPRSSLVKFGRASKELMVCQTDEPYPKDIAKPKRPVAFFQFAVEPFQGKCHLSNRLVTY
jgi:ankyrin repeat protein